MAEPRVVDKLGLLFALPQEEAGFRRVMAESRSYRRKDGAMTQWYLGNLELIAAVSGVGRRRSAAAAERMIDCGVTALMCVGFAAALNPLAQIGDIFVADAVDLQTGNTRAPSLFSSPTLMSVIPPQASDDFRVRTGSLVTTDRVIISASEKSAIRRATAADILDMESYAAAQVCAAKGIPFIAMRAVSDRADQDLPRQILMLLRLKGNLARGLLVVAKPRLWFPLARLHRQASVAASNLADVLGMVLLRLM